MVQRYSVARRKLVAHLQGQGVIRSGAVAEAFLSVPREYFVDSALAAQSYRDDALPIGRGQTISKPSIVARMVELLDAGGVKSLEIGTGSGYTTAVLAQLSHSVCTVERHRWLSLRARRVLQSIGTLNVRFRTGDGADGWPEEAPFDRILVTAGANEVPDMLVEQLSVGGLMVIPLRQKLCTVRRLPDGPPVIEEHGDALFVPFVSERFAASRSGV